MFKLSSKDRSQNKSVSKPIKGGWYSHNPDSGLVIVFVHGFLSDPSCWGTKRWWRTTTSSSFWPNLILNDNRFRNPSIFLASYHTRYDSGEYGISDCSEEVFNQLNREDGEGRSVIKKKEILFVCHSLGGVITRHFLEFYNKEFKLHKIGLVLMASPSLGSKWAIYLSKLANFLRNEMGHQLKASNSSLKELDRRFKRLLSDNLIPNMHGIEFLESRPVCHPISTWLGYFRIPIDPIVPLESGSRYFDYKTIPDTDHFSIVKPNGFNHLSHEFLVDFFTKHFASSHSVEQAKTKFTTEHHETLFEFELPIVGRSELEAKEMLDLFGGRPSELLIGFNAVKHAVYKHCFNRSIVEKLCESILEPTDDSCRSITVRSFPGEGLSLTLGQLVRELASNDDTKVFWVIDNPDQTRSVLNQLSAKEASEFYERTCNSSKSLKQITIVLDDISKASAKEIGKLFEFRDRLKVLVKESEGPKVCFVLGFLGDGDTCGESGTIKLELTDKDRESCYLKMTSATPQVLKGVDGGLPEILLSYPEKRWFMNDAQAFIDFLMEYGQPTEEATKYWLARVDGLDAKGGEILATTAAAQLIGLAIEETVAKRLFNPLIPYQDIMQIVDQEHRLAVVKKDWNGLGLSCPRRARSILERLNFFTFDFLSKTYQKLLTESLDKVAAGQSANSYDFGRHILQRLSKKNLWMFEGKFDIAKLLLKDNVDQISSLRADLSVLKKARWAGTVSAMLRLWGKDKIKEGSSLYQAVQLTMGLCEDTIVEITDNKHPFTPELALSLYRSLMHLMMLNTELNRSIHSLSKKLQYSFESKSFSEMVLAALVSDDNDDPVSYANQLVHVRACFEDSLEGSQSRSYKKFQLDWFSNLKSVFTEHSADFDAGNWLKMADYADTKTKAEFLKKALDLVREDPFNQGTWGKDVNEKVEHFVKINPSYITQFCGVAAKEVLP